MGMSDKARAKRDGRVRRHARVRKQVQGSPERPRLSVYRSNRHMFAQLIDDASGRTLVHASSLRLQAAPAAVTTAADAPQEAEQAEKPGKGGKGGKAPKAAKGNQPVALKGKAATAKAVGLLLAQRAAEQGITSVIFDRGGYRYHGRIAALALGAREGGLKF